MTVEDRIEQIRDSSSIETRLRLTEELSEILYQRRGEEANLRTLRNQAKRNKDRAKAIYILTCELGATKANGTYQDDEKYDIHLAQEIDYDGKYTEMHLQNEALEEFLQSARQKNAHLKDEKRNYNFK